MAAVTFRPSRLVQAAVLLALFAGAGCGGSDTPQKEEPGPGPIPPSGTFAIISPGNASSVDRDVITVRGTGATMGSTVEIDVFTNDWYAQNGTAEIANDGTWAYSPTYLKGQGSYKEHHNIRARLMSNGTQQAISTVYDVAVR
jgi:hypothetical protein